MKSWSYFWFDGNHHHYFFSIYCFLPQWTSKLMANERSTLHYRTEIKHIQVNSVDLLVVIGQMIYMLEIRTNDAGQLSLSNFRKRNLASQKVEVKQLKNLYSNLWASEQHLNERYNWCLCTVITAYVCSYLWLAHIGFWCVFNSNDMNQWPVMIYHLFINFCSRRCKKYS